MRMAKVGVLGGSTKTLLAQLKVPTLDLRSHLRDAVERNSRSGAGLASLTPPSLSKSQSHCKIQNQKRQEKSQGCHHRDSNPGLAASKSKALPLMQIPIPLQGAPRKWWPIAISYVPDNRVKRAGLICEHK